MTGIWNSRNQVATLAILLCLMTTLCGCQAPDAKHPEDDRSQSMKGYELYSWEARGEWYFALLVGTNRTKTIDEVTGPEVRVQGLDALMNALDHLSKGQQVFWSARIRTSSSTG